MSRVAGIFAMLAIWGLHVTTPIVFKFGNVGYSVSGWISGCMFMVVYYRVVVKDLE